MKTIEEVKYHIAYNSGYHSWQSLMKSIEDNEVLEHYIDCVAIVYAEQAIDECASKSQEMLYELPNKADSNGFTIRRWQVCYAVPKQSILKVKEELK